MSNNIYKYGALNAQAHTHTHNMRGEVQFSLTHLLVPYRTRECATPNWQNRLLKKRRDAILPPQHVVLFIY